MSSCVSRVPQLCPPVSWMCPWPLGSASLALPLRLGPQPWVQFGALLPWPSLTCLLLLTFLLCLHTPRLIPQQCRGYLRSSEPSA